jgi:hypothetical protein
MLNSTAIDGFLPAGHVWIRNFGSGIGRRISSIRDRAQPDHATVRVLESDSEAWFALEHYKWARNSSTGLLPSGLLEHHVGISTVADKVLLKVFRKDDAFA